MSPALAGVRRRARTVSRRAVARLRPTASAAAGRLADGARTLPVPHRVRVGMSKALLRKLRPERVPIDSLLLGAQAGLPATRFAEVTDNLLWPSTRVVDGPHVDLLRRGAREGELSTAEILASPYGVLARQCIDLRGSYFGAADDDGIVALARAFVARSNGSATGSGPQTYGSTAHDPILVAPIRWSECLQVLDGHHRLARIAASGSQYVDVTLKRGSVTTPLQDLLNRMSWLEGSRELYQPVDAPELRQSWSTVRRCTDRRDKMLAFLGEGGWLPPAGATTYLDVACFYGWFVAEMQQAGFAARGIERDPLARTVGHEMYGLDPAVVDVGNAEGLLPQTPVTDVVSCFSLLHHFALGRASIDAGALVRLLDQVTGKVLFLDTGQAHEAWFRESLADWDTEKVAAFLREHGSFADVVDLGPDADAVPPYEKNYGRHLFACVKAVG